MTEAGEENHVIISIDLEKVFNIFQQPFMIKILDKLGIKGEMVLKHSQNF